MERYERCYGADFDPAVTIEQRRSCWTEWLERRTPSDTPERARYAKMRMAQLPTTDTTRSLPDPAPSPPSTYAHEYPRSPPAEYPTSACTPLCNDKWAECNTHCQMTDEDCVMACEASYRICIGGCP